MIYTSYYNHPSVKALTQKYPYKFVSIARWTPSWWKGNTKLLQLAPTPELVRMYKAGMIDWKLYREKYRNQILFNKDPKEMFKLLNGKILLCYEKPGENCHRRLVAEWLEEKLGIEVPELPSVFHGIFSKEYKDMPFRENS